MNSKHFLDLYGCNGESDLYSTYSNILDGLFTSDYWSAGALDGYRVPWSLAKAARESNRGVFNSPGLYLWGAGNTPLYVGITGSSFNRRFNRYIWSSRSQCGLAQNYSSSLIEKGIAGFPIDVLDWYSRGYGNSTVRLVGAVRFAQEGIDNVWFSLLPHNNKLQIRELEKRLIGIANQWNIDHGLNPLLNIESNRK